MSAESGHPAAGAAVPAGSSGTAGRLTAVEVDLMVRLQGVIMRRPVVVVARSLSFFGEHAAGFLLLTGLGMVMDRDRRAAWLTAFTATLVAHAAAVVVKRVVRRPRPHDPRVRVGVGTPSALSFPSAHATSTTAAMVATASMIGWPAAVVVVLAMGLSRVVLGVHYPTDVLAGTCLGAVVACAFRQWGWS